MRDILFKVVAFLASVSIARSLTDASLQQVHSPNDNSSNNNPLESAASLSQQRLLVEDRVEPAEEDAAVNGVSRKKRHEADEEGAVEDNNEEEGKETNKHQHDSPTTEVTEEATTSTAAATTESGQEATTSKHEDPVTTTTEDVAISTTEKKPRAKGEAKTVDVAEETETVTTTIRATSKTTKVTSTAVTTTMEAVQEVTTSENEDSVTTTTEDVAISTTEKKPRGKGEAKAVDVAEETDTVTATTQATSKTTKAATTTAKATKPTTTTAKTTKATTTTETTTEATTNADETEGAIQTIANQSEEVVGGGGDGDATLPPRVQEFDEDICKDAGDSCEKCKEAAETAIGFEHDDEPEKDFICEFGIGMCAKTPRKGFNDANGLADEDDPMDIVDQMCEDSTAEPTAAPVDDGNSSAEPTAAPVEQTAEDSPTETPSDTMIETNDKAPLNTGDGNDSDEGGHSMKLIFMLAILGSGLGYYVKSKLSQSANGRMGGGGKYQQISTTEKESSVVASEDADDWGWDDSNGDGGGTTISTIGDVEMPVRTASMDLKRRSSNDSQNKTPSSPSFGMRSTKTSAISPSSGLKLPSAKMPGFKPSTRSTGLPPRANSSDSSNAWSPSVSSLDPSTSGGSLPAQPITKIGKKITSKPKPKVIPLPNDDIFASMGFSANPSFSHAPPPTSKSTTVPNIGSGGGRWATAAATPVAFASTTAAKSTNVASLATTTSADADGDTGNANWGDDGDLDDLLDM